MSRPHDPHTPGYGAPMRTPARDPPPLAGEHGHSPGGSPHLESYEAMNAELNDRLTQSRQDNVDLRRRSQRQRDTLEKIIAQVKGTGAEIHHVSALEGALDDDNPADLDASYDVEASRISSEGETLIAESGFDAPMAAGVEGLFEHLATMTRKVKKLRQKVMALEQQTENQEEELTEMKKERAALKGELYRVPPRTKELPLDDLVFRVRSLCDALYGLAEDENEPKGKKHSKKQKHHQHADTEEGSVDKMKDLLESASSNTEAIKRVLDMTLKQRMVDQGSDTLPESVLAKVNHLRLAGSRKAAESPRRASAAGGDSSAENQTTAMMRLLDLLSSEEEREEEEQGADFDDLSANVCDKALRLRGDMERLRRTANVHSMALTEFEREVLEVTARAGIPPKDCPSAQSILNRLTKAALGEPQLPPMADRTPVRGSDEPIQDDSCWVMLAWERIHHLRRAVAGGNSTNPRVAHFNVAPTKLLQRYHSFVANAVKGSSHTQQMGDAADNVRGALWTAMSQLEETVAEHMRGAASKQKAQPESSFSSQDGGAGGSHPYTRLLQLLPTSCKPRDPDNERECFESVRFALSMHNAMASAALLNPATIGRCTKVLDATCCANHPGLEGTDAQDFAMTDWNVLLRGVGVETGNNIPTTEDGEGAAQSIFSFTESKSIPEAVDALTARLSHFGDKYFMKQQAYHLELQESRMELHHCYAQLTKYLLPQEYASAQLSSERPNVTMAELLVKLDDRVRTYESLSHKQQRSNDIAKAERARMEQLLQTKITQLGKVVGSIKLPPAQSMAEGGDVNADQQQQPEDDAVSLPSAITMTDDAGSNNDGAPAHDRHRPATTRGKQQTGPGQQPAPFSVPQYEALLVDIEKRVEHLKYDHGRLQSHKEETRVRMENYESSHSTMTKRLVRIEASARQLASSLEVPLPKDLQPKDPKEVTSGPNPTAAPGITESTRVILEIMKLSQTSLKINKEADTQVLVTEVGDLKKSLGNAEEAVTDTDNTLKTVESVLASHCRKLVQSLAVMTPALPRLEAGRQQKNAEDEDEEEQEQEEEEQLTLLLSDLQTLSGSLRSTGEHMETELRRSLKFLQSFYEASFGERPEIFDGNLEDMINTLGFLSDKLLGAYRKDGVAAKVNKIFTEQGTTPVLSPESPFRPRGSSTNTSFNNVPTSPGGGNTSASLHNTRDSDQPPVFVVDTRVLKLHESVSRLATKIKALFEVPYLAVRELAEAAEARNPASSAGGAQYGEEADQMYIIQDVPPLQSPYSEDTLIQTLEVNLQYVERQLHKFGSGYKHAAVLVQRDVDRANKPLLVMLEALQDTTVDELGITQEQVQELHGALSESKLCYFQRPVEPEKHEALWVQASHLLGYVFPNIVSAVVGWSKTGNQMKSQLDSVVELVRKLDAEEDHDAPGRPGPPRVGYSNIVERLEQLIRSVKSEQHVRDLEAAVERVTEDSQLLKETAALDEQRLHKHISELEGQVEELTLQRDTSNSAAAVARSLLRKQEEQEASRLADASSRPSSAPRQASPRRPPYEQPTFSAEEKHVLAWKKSPPRNRAASPLHSSVASGQFSRQYSAGGSSQGGASQQPPRSTSRGSAQRNGTPTSRQPGASSVSASKRRIAAPPSQMIDPVLNQYAEALKSELVERQLSPSRARSASKGEPERTGTTHRKASPVTIHASATASHLPSHKVTAINPKSQSVSGRSNTSTTRSTTSAVSLPAAGSGKNNQWISVSPQKKNRAAVPPPQQQQQQQQQQQRYADSRGQGTVITPQAKPSTRSGQSHPLRSTSGSRSNQSNTSLTSSSAAAGSSRPRQGSATTGSGTSVRVDKAMGDLLNALSSQQGSYR